MKKYQIKIDFDSANPQVIFDAVDTEKEVNEWLESALNSDGPTRVAVYELNEDAKGYYLCQQYTRIPEPVDRLSGFGRW